LSVGSKEEVRERTAIAAEGALARALPARRKMEKARRLALVPQGRRAQSSGFAAMVDFAIIFFIGATYILLSHGTWPGSADWLNIHGFFFHQWLVVAIYAFLFVACADYYRLYRDQLPIIDTALAAMRSALTAAMMMAAFFYLAGTGKNTRPTLFFVAILTLPAASALHVLRRVYFRRAVVRDELMTNVLIMGAGAIGTELAQYLKQSPWHRVIGFLDDHREDDPQVLGSSSDLAEIARQYFIDEVVVTIPSQRELVKKLALQARMLRLDVKVVPELYDGIASNAPVEYLAHLPVRVLHREPIPATGWMLKRICDVTVASLLLMATAPLFVVIAILLKLESKGPVLYRSHRVGKKGRIFTFYKFRTMVKGADGLKTNLEENNERNSVLFKVSKDPRITRVGRMLRKFSLDEIPQLINVLKGDMSLVGPRPPLPSEFKQYRLDHLRRLDVVPGITGLWQITCRQDPSFDNYIALDLEYIENWSLGLDFKILLRTIPAVFKGTGV
jgi:exopolysaccharide biosynthesis polyprenyl glycosylphosphotransferase